MRCADCHKLHKGIQGLMPRPAGKVDDAIMPAWDMVCSECSRKVPIDQTSKDDENYPF